jgi:hypothetical protein
MNTLTYKNEKYPFFQSLGNASQFAIPYAKYFCIGKGYDIGFCKEEWKYPNSIGIDYNINNNYNANNLPDDIVDYIYSSHCLEHVDNWSQTLEYWMTKVKNNGIIFLYLPDISQKYWRPWHNKKHNHVFNPQILKLFLEDHNITDFFISGIDLNNSFMVVFTNVY